MKTRFGYAVSCIENLLKYIDTDPILNDPMPLVDDSLSAVEGLKKLEESFNRVSNKSPGKAAYIDSAVYSWKKRHKKFFDDGKELVAVLDKYKDEIDKIENTAKTMRTLCKNYSSIESRLKSIENGLKKTCEE